MRKRHNAEPSQCITKFIQMIDNIHNDFQPFACIMTEKYDNIPRYQSNYYLREESKKECREETAQNKVDKLLTSLQRDKHKKKS